MDSRAFDDFVRSMAFPTTRRGFAVALAAGLVAWRHGQAEAQVSTQLGHACLNPDACYQDGYGEIVCASNGLYEGVCCRASGCCTYDTDCCGEMQCAPSGDVCRYCAYPPFPTKGIGEACSSASECVELPAGIIHCADSGLGYPACCFDEGSFCGATGTGCCGGMSCIDGQCRYPGYGNVVLEPCYSDSDCSQATGVTVCGVNARGAGCCRVEGQSCGHWDGCCEPLHCDGAVCRYS